MTNQNTAVLDANMLTKQHIPKIDTTLSVLADFILQQRRPPSTLPQLPPTYTSASTVSFPLPHFTLTPAVTSIAAPPQNNQLNE